MITIEIAGNFYVIIPLVTQIKVFFETELALLTRDGV